MEWGSAAEKTKLGIVRERESPGGLALRLEGSWGQGRSPQADPQGSRCARLGKTRGEEESSTQSKQHMQRLRGRSEPHIQKEQRDKEGVGDQGPGEVRQAQKWARSDEGWQKGKVREKALLLIGCGDPDTQAACQHQS